jgi:hypothetical protein
MAVEQSYAPTVPEEDIVVDVIHEDAAGGPCIGNLKGT